MASESRDTTDVTVSLPADLESWLDQQADELGIDRESVLVQLLASYRAADELDDDVAISQQEAIDAAVESVVSDRLPEVADAVEQRIQAPEMDALEERIDDLDADFRDKLDDVRKRVIQVKKEADAKAPADHSHESIERRLDELESAVDRLDTLERQVESIDVDRIDEVETELDGVESQVAELRGRLDEAADASDHVTELDDRLDDVEEKLQTVAWVVRDLRDARTEGTTVEAIKREAAGHDLSRARCENCGQGVEVGLLTEPSCPHCDAALNGIEPSSRPFGIGAAKLTVAAQIEAGAAADSGDEIDDIETDGPGDRR